MTRNPEDIQRILGLAAFFLSYPDQRWREDFSLAQASLKEVEDKKAASTLQDFAKGVQAMDPYEFESRYVQAFDFSQNTNLYLTSRSSKDTGQQRMGLLSYQMTFEEAGFQVHAETPDYLPAMLELASAVDAPMAGSIMASAAHDIELLRDAVKEAEGLDEYVTLLDLVLEEGAELKEVAR